MTATSKIEKTTPVTSTTPTTTGRKYNGNSKKSHAELLVESSSKLVAVLVIHSRSLLSVGIWLIRIRWAAVELRSMHCSIVMFADAEQCQVAKTSQQCHRCIHGGRRFEPAVSARNIWRTPRRNSSATGRSESESWSLAHRQVRGGLSNHLLDGDVDCRIGSAAAGIAWGMRAASSWPQASAASQTTCLLRSSVSPRCPRHAPAVAADGLHATGLMALFVDPADSRWPAAHSACRVSSWRASSVRRIVMVAALTGVSFGSGVMARNSS